MPPHPLTNFEIQKYYKNGPRFNGVYSRDHLNKIRDKVYVINLHEYSDIGTYWITLYIQSNDVTYFDSSGVEHIPIEIKTLISNKTIKTNTFRMQAYDSIIIGYFCVGSIDSFLAGKTEFRNLVSPNKFKRNNDIILRYVMTKHLKNSR